MSARCESVGLRCGIDQIGSDEVWCKSIAAEVEVAGVITSPHLAPHRASLLTVVTSRGQAGHC